MSSAICFNLDQYKILSSGNGLTINYRILRLASSTWKMTETIVDMLTKC